MKQGKANRVWLREYTGHRKYHIPVQEMTLRMDNTTDQHWNQTDYFLCSQRYGETLYSQQK